MGQINQKGNRGLNIEKALMKTIRRILYVLITKGKQKGKKRENSMYRPLEG